MRLMVLRGIVLLTTALAFTACSSKQETHSAPAMSESSTMSQSPAMSHSPAMSESPVAGSASTRTGTFSGLNGKHVAGTVTITGGQIALNGFSSDEGPDLHIYLTNGSDESAVTAGKELGSISFDKASQQFSTDGADLATYTNIVIHCDKAKAVFGAATLT